MFVLTAARSALLRALIVVAPVRCAMCGRYGAHLCATCRTRYMRSRLGYRRHTASLPIVYALGTHDGPLRRAILGLKYRNQSQAAYELGALLGKKLTCAVEALVPVALHPRRQRARGCNQAEAIAHGIAAACNAAVFTDALVRRRVTLPQSSLHVHERERNVAEAFSVGPGVGRLQGLRTLIVDDVVTTGATIAACAAILRSAGVDVIGAASLALRR